MKVNKMRSVSTPSATQANEKGSHGRGIQIIRVGIRGTKGPRIEKALPKWSAEIMAAINDGRK